MDTIRFRATVDQEQVIRPPAGVSLPQGEIEVTVQPRAIETNTSSDSMATTRAWLLEFAHEAEAARPSLPNDLAEHHDHYAHGKPRQ